MNAIIILPLLLKGLSCWIFITFKHCLNTLLLNAVFKKLKTINERKAAGPDKIPCTLLKIAAEVIAPSLTQIFDKSIRTSIFPDDWKLARVTPIFKKGK